MKKIVLFAVLGLLLVVIAGGVTYFFIAPKVQPKVLTKVIHDSSLVIGPTFTLPDRVVNLADPGANRYLKVSMVLAFSPELDSQSDVNKIVNQRMTILEDMLTTILSSQTTTQLLTSQGKEDLKKTIITQFSTVLDNVHLVDIYFTDFVMQ
jgi:flagellar basal body-associated protein FliL